MSTGLKLVVGACLVGLGSALTCMVGAVSTAGAIDCTGSNRITFANYTSTDTTTYMDTATPCCMRTVSGPSVSLSCGSAYVDCGKDKCWETGSEGDFERSFQCACSGDNCNGAAGLASAAALAVAAAGLALLRH